MDKLDMLYNEILTFITNALGVPGEPFTAGKFTGVGWLYFHYKSASYNGMYPRIALKRQMHSVNVYVMGKDDHLLDAYAADFGKTAVGKGCIRIKNLTPVRKARLLQLVNELAATTQ